MQWMLPALAFALLIGDQFLAAIVVISNGKAIYGEVHDRNEPQHSLSDQTLERKLPAIAA